MNAPNTLKLTATLPRKKFIQDLINTKYITITDQPADIPTKGLSRVQHQYLNSKIGVLNIFYTT